MSTGKNEEQRTRDTPAPPRTPAPTPSATTEPVPPDAPDTPDTASTPAGPAEPRPASLTKQPDGTPADDTRRPLPTRPPRSENARHPGTRTPETTGTPETTRTPKTTRTPETPDQSAPGKTPSPPSPEPKTPAPASLSPGTTGSTTAPSRRSWPQAVPHQQSPATPQPPPPTARPVPAARPAPAGRSTPVPASRPAPAPRRATASASPRTPGPSPAPSRARAHTPYPGVSTATGHYSQHRRQPDDAPEPIPAASGAPVDRSAPYRARATGFATGVLHALGFTLLTVYEYFRTSVQALTEVQRAAGGSAGLREIADLQAELVQQSWYGVLSDVVGTLTFGQPRAALWTAVFLAVLVRLNQHGPARVQLGLSVLAAGYCALIALLWFPFLYALGSITFVALAATGAVLWAATRR